MACISSINYLFGFQEDFSFLPCLQEVAMAALQAQVSQLQDQLKKAKAASSPLGSLSEQQLQALEVRVTWIYSAAKLVRQALGGAVERTIRQRCGRCQGTTALARLIKLDFLNLLACAGTPCCNRVFQICTSGPVRRADRPASRGSVGCKAPSHSTRLASTWASACWPQRFVNRS